jgi:amidase
VSSGAAPLTGPVTQALRQVDACEPTLNCFVSDRRQRALDELAGVGRDAPFRGVPALIKDLSCGIAGEPMWNGNRALQRLDVRAAHDSFVVRRLRAAGFVVLGRTNTAEFGSTITTEPGATGSTHNPWDPTLTAGGSSGGSAAAVAAGYAPVAHGTDASGSVRIPAGACGVVGFKPTNGAIPLDPEECGGWHGLSTTGIIARRASDVAAVFGVLQGLQGSPRSGLQRPHGERLRIAVLDTASLSVAPDVAAAQAEAAGLLGALGHRIELASPSFMRHGSFHRLFLTLVASGLAAEVTRWEQRLGERFRQDDFDATTWPLLELGRAATEADVEGALAWRREFARTVDDWWAEGVDILVTPVLARAHSELGWFSDPRQGGRRVREAMQFTAQFNAAGNPAISLPLQQTPGGLPIGTQLVARRGDDELLLRLAHELEEATGWTARHPPLASVPDDSRFRGRGSQKGGQLRCVTR